MRCRGGPVGRGGLVGRGALLVFLWGCSGDEGTGGGTSPAPRPEAELVDMTVWTLGDEAIAPDPFLSHEPEGISLQCPLGTYLNEGAAFEIRTGLCPYA